MKDLEIRGAGNILGAEQSGNIHAVGFDLYTRLLSNAVEELRARGERRTVRQLRQPANSSSGRAMPNGTVKPIDGSALQQEERAEPSLDIGVPASIPEDYIEDLPARLRMYQRIVTLGTAQGQATTDGKDGRRRRRHQGASKRD